VTDNSTAPQITGAPKPAQPTTGTADASVCGAGGPGCDHSVLQTIVHNETAGPPGSSTPSCGPSGCPTPDPAIPAAPRSGAPVGPSNAGTGGPGGPGHAGGSGAARLNAAGSTDPNATGPSTGAPRQDTLDPNQSANAARGPPPPSADPTNPNAAPVAPGPGTSAGQLPDGAVVARPGSTPAPDSQRVTIDGQQVDMPADSLNWLNPNSSARNLNTESGQKLMVGTCTAGSVQCVAHATDGSNQDIPFERENPGKSVPDAMTKQTIDQWGHKVDPSIAATPSPADVAATRADNAARQAQGARNANKVLDGLSYVPDVGPVVRGARGIKSLSDLFRGQNSQPKTETPATAPGPAEPAADPGPGRVINRPSATPGAQPSEPMRPAGRPSAGAGTRPTGAAGTRPGGRTRGPRRSGGSNELAPVGGGKDPLTGAAAGQRPGNPPRSDSSLAPTSPARADNTRSGERDASGATPDGAEGTPNPRDRLTPQAGHQPDDHAHVDPPAGAPGAGRGPDQSRGNNLEKPRAPSRGIDPNSASAHGDTPAAQPGANSRNDPADIANGQLAQQQRYPELSTTVSPQAQGRHVRGAPQYTRGGYFNSRDDAQKVLDAFHDGTAQIVGVSRSGYIVVRYSGVTGYNHNPGAGYINQPTNLFSIKGTSKVSVVPVPPTGVPMK